MVAWKSWISFDVFNLISHKWAWRTSVVSSWTLEKKFHISTHHEYSLRDYYQIPFIFSLAGAVRPMKEDNQCYTEIWEIAGQTQPQMSSRI